VVGYALLNFDDEYKLTELGIFSARYAYLAPWDLARLLDDLAGHQVSLPATWQSSASCFSRIRASRDNQRRVLFSDQVRHPARRSGVGVTLGPRPVPSRPRLRTMPVPANRHSHRPGALDNRTSAVYPLEISSVLLGPQKAPPATVTRP
jgi:hypothetical protein